MVGVRLTAAQARALGIDPGEYHDVTAPTPSAGKPRRQRRAEPYATVCVNCGEAFTTRVSETRHFQGTGHLRYQLVLDL